MYNVFYGTESGVTRAEAELPTQKHVHVHIETLKCTMYFMEQNQE